MRAVLAESVERIHRSNLIWMGVLPLQLRSPAKDLGPTGEEAFEVTGLAEPLNGGSLPTSVHVVADEIEFDARVLVDTTKEVDYYFRRGGIPQYVLRPCTIPVDALRVCVWPG